MWWHYDQLPSGEPYEWSVTEGESAAQRGDSPWDNIDFHVDLGCGKLKKGRIGIDKFRAPGVDIQMDLDTLEFGGVCKEGFATFSRQLPVLPGRLPFDTNSIESIISHHCMEHLGDGFIRLMDECYRVLKPGGILRIIVPLFPSRTAVEDADHRRYFMVDTFDAFCGAEDGACWLESFSVPYTSARFEMVEKDYTARLEDPEEWWGPDDARELRVALRKYALEAKDGGPSEGDVQEGWQDADGSDDLDDADGAAEARGDRELAGVA